MKLNVPGTLERADVVIVGADPAGSFLAYLLVRASPASLRRQPAVRNRPRRRQSCLNATIGSSPAARLAGTVLAMAATSRSRIDPAM
jgi:hypothetical protein